MPRNRYRTMTGRLMVGCAMLGCALGMVATGCGSSAGPSASAFAGRWHGSVPHALKGADVLIDIDARPTVNAPDIYVGTISTDASQCFTAGILAATYRNGTIMASGVGSGTATTVTITGQMDAGAISGLFAMMSDVADCVVATTAIDLRHE